MSVLVNRQNLFISALCGQRMLFEKITGGNGYLGSMERLTARLDVDDICFDITIVISEYFSFFKSLPSCFEIC